MRATNSEFGDAYDDGDHGVGDAVVDQVLSEIPHRGLLLIDAATSVGDTIAAMNEKHLGYALIVEEGKLAGIFTERDALTKVVGGPQTALSARVDTIMTRDPDTLPAHASVAFALHRMSVEGYRHIPLVDAESRPVGCVSVRDIVDWMVDLFPDSVMNLPPEPGYPTSVDGG